MAIGLSRRCPKLARNQKPRTAAARSRTRRARRSRGTAAAPPPRAGRSGRVRGDARHRSRRREPPPWFVCAAETDEEKSSAQTGRRRRNCFSRIRAIPLLEVQTVLPATSERCRWSTHVALARARAQKQPVHSRKSFQMSERKAVIKNADMSEVRVRRVTRYRAVSVASARGNGMPLRAVFSSPREIEHLPATAPSAALDRPWDARLTAFIPPQCCFANNRTSSRMPWTAPPRCVSSKTRVRRLLELTNERTARVFLTGGGRVIASLAIDHARSRHRRRERASRGDQHATAFADFVLVVGRLTLANGRARSSPRRSVFGARTLAKIVPSRRDETPPRLGSVAPLDTPRRRI